MVFVQQSADQQQRHLCFKMDHLDVLQNLDSDLFETNFSIYSRRSKNNMRQYKTP